MTGFDITMPLDAPEEGTRDKLARILRGAVDRFRGVDPETGEADYWKRGGLAGLLGMPSWDEQSPQEIAMGFAGSTTPAVKGLTGALSAPAKTIRAYHGSPHDFDRFDLSKIGTGEGAQAYGHGLYFAENEGVAKSYRDALSDTQKQWLVDGNVVGQYGQNKGPLGGAAARLRQVMARDGVATEADARAALERFESTNRTNKGLFPASYFKEVSEAIPQLVGREIGERSPGRMYEVEINADPERFLDWDKPFAQQHGDVQDAINNLWIQKGGSLEGRTLPPFSASEALTTGESLYPAIATTYGKGGNARLQEAGSNALRERGIPGIKYLDQGSRSAGEGSRNYVVFDDGLISILRKYGLLPAAGLGAATAGAEP